MENRAYRQEKEGKKRMIDFHEVLAHMNTKQRINYDKVFQQMEKAGSRKVSGPEYFSIPAAAPAVPLYWKDW